MLKKRKRRGKRVLLLLLEVGDSMKYIFVLKVFRVTKRKKKNIIRGIHLFTLDIDDTNFYNTLFMEWLFRRIGLFCKLYAPSVDEPYRVYVYVRRRSRRKGFKVVATFKILSNGVIVDWIKAVGLWRSAKLMLQGYSLAYIKRMELERRIERMKRSVLTLPQKVKKKLYEDVELYKELYGG